MRCAWLVAVFLLASATAKEFAGVPWLTAFSRRANAQLLLYFNNENNFWLLKQGRAVPLNVDAHLWAPETCCAHRATPSLSRDGRYLAYVHLKSTHPRREAVTVLDAQTNSSQEVFTAAMIWGMSWAPDGDRLAVIADREGGRGHKIFIVERKTSSVTEINSEPARNYAISDYVSPSWNPAGTKLTLELRRSGPGANNSTAGVIAVWDLASQRMRIIAEGVESSWSPADDHIAFFDPSRRQCFLVKSDGTERRLLFSSTTGILGIGGRAPLFFPVVWSPDARQLIFHEWVDADLITEVYEFDLSRGKIRHLGRSEVQVVDWR